MTPIIPAENIVVTADEKKIIRSLRSFSSGCCGGIDGLRPAHLLDLVAVSTAEAGLHLRRSITNLTYKILRGDVSDYAVKLLFFIESHRFEEERRRHPTDSGRQRVSPFSG